MLYLVYTTQSKHSENIKVINIIYERNLLLIAKNEIMKNDQIVSVFETDHFNMERFLFLGVVLNEQEKFDQIKPLNDDSLSMIKSRDRVYITNYVRLKDFYRE